MSVQKWDWVARALAETATQDWAGVISLSYDSTPTSLDGSKAFVYKHVQDWIRALRDEASKKAGYRVKLRYLVAGEVGSKKGRVHWHVILWSQCNIFALGEWSDFWRQWDAGYPPSAGAIKKYWCDHEHQKKLVWSKWPFGNVVTDPVNKQTAEYVLKYALKAKYGGHKSKGQRRFVKSEVHAASYFRVSTGQPIGWDYVKGWLAEIWQRGQVPPKLTISVPGMRGYWWPRGEMRNRILEALASYDNERPLAGWVAFEQLCVQTEFGEATLAKIEEFRNGKEEEGEREVQRVYGQQDKHRVCGRVWPCSACTAGATDEQLGEIVLRAVTLRRRWQREARKLRGSTAGAEYGPDGPSFDAWAISKREVNPFCQYPRFDARPAGYATKAE